MNLQFLGDALDHWKGALLGRLVRAGALESLGVYPMAIDHGDWNEADYAIYADLLQIPADTVYRDVVPLTRKNRTFGSLPHRGDVFLDPDTGIASGKVKTPGQYVYPGDVSGLLESSGRRVVAVYQHVSRKRVAERVDRVVQEMPPGLLWGSYESGSVAMLFFSHDPRRIDRIVEHLRSYLGRHAEKRVRCGNRAMEP